MAAMKYYIASLLVFTDVQDQSGTSPLFLTMSMPAMIPAESIEEAGELARQQMFERWKPDEGWHSHQANILPVSDEIYESIFELDDTDALDVDDSEGQTFNFPSR
jgi:hypothetical protein